MTSIESEPACVFCEELACGGAIAELGDAAALRDRFPVTDGHTLIIPRRHVADPLDLSDDEARDIWRLLKLIREELNRDDHTIRGYNIGVNSGSVAGQTVPHAHVHLIPRRKGDTAEPRGGVRGVIPGEMSYSPR
jgi:diadenosine tetraphosphate (Ap4A) HIT family hydrolase